MNIFVLVRPTASKGRRRGKDNFRTHAKLSRKKVSRGGGRKIRNMHGRAQNSGKRQRRQEMASGEKGEGRRRPHFA